MKPKILAALLGSRLESKNQPASTEYEWPDEAPESLRWLTGPGPSRTAGMQKTDWQVASAHARLSDYEGNVGTRRSCRGPTNPWRAWTGMNQTTREPNPFRAEGLLSRKDRTLGKLHPRTKIKTNGGPSSALARLKLGRRASRLAAPEPVTPHAWKKNQSPVLEKTLVGEHRRQMESLDPVKNIINVKTLMAQFKELIGKMN
jgi:hypothetical protein